MAELRFLKMDGGKFVWAGMAVHGMSKEDVAMQVFGFVESLAHAASRPRYFWIHYDDGEVTAVEPPQATGAECPASLRGEITLPQD